MCLMCKPTKNVKWLCSLQLKMILKKDLEFISWEWGSLKCHSSISKSPSFCSFATVWGNQSVSFLLYRKQETISAQFTCISMTTKKKQEWAWRESCLFSTTCHCKNKTKLLSHDRMWSVQLRNAVHWGSPHGGDTHPVTPPTPKESL